MPSYFLRLLPAACLSLGAFAAFSGFQTPDPVMQRLATRLQAYYTEAQPEVSYLHLNQDAYAAGETLWFKAYVVDGSTHQPDSLSGVLYVDMVSPSGRQVPLRRTLALRGGVAHGDIQLPDSLPQGIYTLRAYTNWMRNSGEELFFSRRVPVWQAVPSSRASSRLTDREMSVTRRKTAIAARPDVQFFPEGGDYVAGLATVVGVKALDATGTGLAVRGTILDDQNQLQATFTTSALGMTAVSFAPVAGRRYLARVVLPTGTTADYALPEVRPDGWVMNVRDVGPHLQVLVRYQPPQGGGPAPAAKLRLLGHVRGTVVYTGTGTVPAQETFAATVPKTGLPAGIVHFTLFDDQQIARAERLAFVPEAAPLSIRFQPEKTTYGPREAVTVTVDVRNAAGAPAAAELSVAVANDTGLPTIGTTDATIESHLLLTSELKGYVENPGYYFRIPTPETRLALDHLLLTQGWSRFVWRELLGETSPAAAYRFLPEQNLTLGGRLVRANQKPVPNGSVTLFQQADKSVSVSQSNVDGQFLFLGFPAQDSAKVVMQARTDKGGSNVLIQLNELWPLPAKPLPLPLQVPAAAVSEVADYAQRSRRQQILEQQYRPDSSRSVLLRNVTVKGAHPAGPAHDPRSIHGTSSNVLLLSNIPTAGSYTDIFQLMQGRVPGVQITRSGYSYNVRIRGVTSMSAFKQPLFLLDGMPLLDINGLVSIPPTIVERIEVLKGASAAIYGSRGGSGVIAVFTKRGNSDYDYSQDPAAGVVVRQLPAYYRPREFYAPRYEKAPAANRPDPRAATLYWLPRLSVPASGTARFTFYTADQNGTFRISAEGLGATGQPVLGSTALTIADR